MAWTPRDHFDEDFGRAESVLALGASASPPVSEDLFRQSVSMAVGAMDAYLCDAYIHVLVSTIRAFRAGTIGRLPSGFSKERLPVGPLLGTSYASRPNWALRMAARERMERENLMRVSRVKSMLNPGLPPGQKLWSDLIDTYIGLNRKRLTQWKTAEVSAATPARAAEMRTEAATALQSRIGQIVQRRHDIAHNCDRPKTAIQSITSVQAKRMLEDIGDFVRILDDHLAAHRIT